MININDIIKAVVTCVGDPKNNCSRKFKEDIELYYARLILIGECYKHNINKDLFDVYDYNQSTISKCNKRYKQLYLKDYTFRFYANQVIKSLNNL